MLVLSSVFVLSFAILFLAMDRAINPFDEGIVLVGAMRVAAGDLIHRDFYSIYGPASYYLLAALFEVFPLHFVVARIFGIAVMAATVAAVTAMLLDRARPFFVVAVASATLLLLFASPFYLYPLFPSLLLTCASVVQLTKPGPIDSPGRLAIVGACAGAAAYFRYDVAALLCLCAATSVILLIAIGRPAGTRFRDAARALGLIAGAAAAVFAPGAIAYLALAPWARFQADVIDYGIHQYAAMRGLPFPGSSALRLDPGLVTVYLPPLAFAIGATEIARRDRTGKAGRLAPDPTVRAIAICAVFSLGLFAKGWVRVSTLHMMTAIVPALVVLGLCADALWSRRRRAGSALLVLLVTAPAALDAASEARLHVGDAARSPLGWIARAAIDREPLSSGPPNCPQRPAFWGARIGPDEAAIANYIRRVTPAEERILVALDQHDRVWVNAVSLYFIADRMPATHWHQFDPGLQTRADIQAAMIDELRAQPVRLIVRDRTFSYEPNDSRRSSGVHLLDDFIARHYRKVAVAGARSVWLRIGVAVPADVPYGRAACMPDAVPEVAPSSGLAGAPGGNTR